METPLDGHRSPRPARGFTLIEIVVVLFILGVAIAMAVALTNALTASQRLSTTTARMQTIDSAIVQFVVLQKRLPCPANITRPTTDALYGKQETPDDTTGCPSEQNGVVPWVTLGLSQSDVTDGWGHLLMYRVEPVLAAKSGMDMSWCDPAGTDPAVNLAGTAPSACNPSCTVLTNNPYLQNCTSPSNFLSGGGGSGRGLTIQNVVGTVVMAPPSTGAAYVVISAGPSGGHGFTPTGQISPSLGTDGGQEKINYADLPLQLYYVDDSTSDNPHFDDIVSRPSVQTVINKAGLSPRPHPS